MTWRRLRAYLNGLRWTRESAFWRALDDGEGFWTPDTHLLAAACDALNAANWQRSEDGSKGRNRPQPVPRPSDKRMADDKANAVRAAIEERKRRRRQQTGG